MAILFMYPRMIIHSSACRRKELVEITRIDPEDMDIIEDATLDQKRECVIETGNGVFDCSLGTQLEALNEELRLLAYGTGQQQIEDRNKYGHSN